MLLAIETATRSGSIAVLSGGKEEERRLGPQSASALAPAVHQLIETWGPPTAYAIDLGPGSFTGLRIGLSFLKGLARARPAPCIALHSLEVLAEEMLARAPAGSIVLPILKASGASVFAATYRAGEEGPEAVSPVPIGLHSGTSIVSRVRETGGDWVVAGEGLPEGIGTLAQDELRVPRALVLGRMGQRKLMGGDGVSAAQLEPAYFQLSAAEEKKRNRS